MARITRDWRIGKLYRRMSDASALLIKTSRVGQHKSQMNPLICYDRLAKGEVFKLTAWVRPVRASLV